MSKHAPAAPYTALGLLALALLLLLAALAGGCAGSVQPRYTPDADQAILADALSRAGLLPAELASALGALDRLAQAAALTTLERWGLAAIDAARGMGERLIGDVVGGWFAARPP